MTDDATCREFDWGPSYRPRHPAPRLVAAVLATLLGGWVLSGVAAEAPPARGLPTLRISPTAPEPLPSHPLLGGAQALEAPNAGPAGADGVTALPVQLAAPASVPGVPAVALRAYQLAATTVRQRDPGCGLDWALLAAIGLVESDHGRFAGAVLGPDGVSHPPVVGPVLDGSAGFATVLDTDDGRLDGDVLYDRAVGPMQFLPGTWAVFGADGDADGVLDPGDLDDAALATAAYLCSGGQPLTTPAGARASLLRYNASSSYADTVLTIAEGYRALGDGLSLHVVTTGPLQLTGWRTRSWAASGRPLGHTTGQQRPTHRPPPRPTHRPTPSPTHRPTPAPTPTDTPDYPPALFPH